MAGPWASQRLLCSGVYKSVYLVISDKKISTQSSLSKREMKGLRNWVEELHLASGVCGPVNPRVLGQCQVSMNTSEYLRQDTCDESRVILAHSPGSGSPGDV